MSAKCRQLEIKIKIQSGELTDNRENIDMLVKTDNAYSLIIK